MKRVYFADQMAATPFWEGVRRDSLQLPPDVTLVRTAEEADVIVSRFHHALAAHFGLRRQYYLWTHEPAWCTLSATRATELGTGHTIHASTAWNGDIYLEPLYYFPFRHPDPAELKELVRAKSRQCVVLASYRERFDRYQGDRNVDLTELRQRIAVELQDQHGLIDIYGLKWPGTVTVTGESRRGGWVDAKREILSPYAFNLAFENTVAHNYVTEKLWHAYQAGCVPIYFLPGTGADQVVGPESMLDWSTVSGVEELADRMRSMPWTECWEIVASGVEAMARVCARSSRDEVFARIVDRFVERVRAM